MCHFASEAWRFDHAVPLSGTLFPVLSPAAIRLRLPGVCIVLSLTRHFSDPRQDKPPAVFSHRFLRLPVLTWVTDLCLFFCLIHVLMLLTAESWAPSTATGARNALLCTSFPPNIWWMNGRMNTFINSFHKHHRASWHSFLVFTVDVIHDGFARCFAKIDLYT